MSPDAPPLSQSSDYPGTFKRFSPEQMIKIIKDTYNGQPPKKPTTLKDEKLRGVVRDGPQTEVTFHQKTGDEAIMPRSPDSKARQARAAKAAINAGEMADLDLAGSSDPAGGRAEEKKLADSPDRKHNRDGKGGGSGNPGGNKGAAAGGGRKEKGAPKKKGGPKKGPKQKGGPKKSSQKSQQQKEGGAEEGVGASQPKGSQAKGAGNSKSQKAKGRARNKKDNPTQQTDKAH